MAKKPVQQNSSESLARSHSKASNAKLTLLCLVTVLVFSLLWVSLGLVPSGLFSPMVLVGAAVVFGGLTFLCIVGFSKFTR